MQTYGSSWRQDADKELLHEYFMRPLFDPDAFLHPRVLLLRRLAHPVNADMAWYRNEVVDRVDGRTINSLAELAATLDSFRPGFRNIPLDSFELVNSRVTRAGNCVSLPVNKKRAEKGASSAPDNKEAETWH